MDSLRDTILNIILIIPGMLLAFTFHEYAHAYVADKLGDKTPRFQGRLTLNPISHIDPIGFIAVLIFRFGWAKPVQTNPSAYKNYYKDDLKVSLAGPIANFLVAIVMAVILGLFARFGYRILPESLAGVLFSMIQLAVIVNVNIGLFNLIPIPGLDGFSLLRDLKPNTFHRYEEKFYQYQMLIMLALIFVGGRIIQIPASFILKGLMTLASQVVNLF
ncbi:peptidase family M50 [Clostridium puniceum]|uniref:Peptidase family M50 n=1 Tax=Clostridium puniceum TaxID=29367 RepID=A0A1S8T9M2_9CLOT|nr:site-2 protease family protein [Clostridium puniceum]OOM74294.1 peptidase family M50 [Clostridium puniceum]